MAVIGSVLLGCLSGENLCHRALCESQIYVPGSVGEQKNIIAGLVVTVSPSEFVAR